MKTLAEIKDYEAYRNFDLTKTYTCDEFEVLVVAAFACDLLYGKIIDWGINDMRQSMVRMNMLWQVSRHNDKRERGIELGGVSVRFTDDTNLAPNISFWSNERRPPLEDASVKIPPDLAVEVMTSSKVRNDWWPAYVREKIKVYKAGGVKLIWLVEPETEQIEVHRPGQVEPIVILSARAGDSLSGAEVLPDFNAPLDEIFDYS